MKHVKHIKYILHADRYIKQLPSYDKFGRKSTFRLNPDNIPDLQWNLANSYHTTSIGLIISSIKVISTNYIDINTLHYTKVNKCNMWYGVSLSNHVTIVQSNTKPIVSTTVICMEITI